MTSIEWLLNQMTSKADAENKYFFASEETLNLLFEQAKQMHKAEILAAFTEGASDGFDGEYDSNREKYYQETFKQPKQ
jgi:hypothetical protein